MPNKNLTPEHVLNKQGVIDKGTGFLVCPTCKYKITVFPGLRCPRCYGLLTAIGCSGACRGCRAAGGD